MYYSDENNIESEPIIFLTCCVTEKKENMLTFSVSSIESSEVEVVLYHSGIHQYSIS